MQGLNQKPSVLALLELQASKMLCHDGISMINLFSNNCLFVTKTDCH